MKKPPIDTIELFPVLNQKLIELLNSLSRGDWNKTAVKLWTVKDVAAHLLDGNLRRIALHRDNYFYKPDNPISSYKDLVDFLNGLNTDWVKAAKRLSPQILIEHLSQTNLEVYKLFKELDPFEKAAFGVAWAGEQESENWFDIAREYTERWHHQQQIRDAVGKEGIMTEELYHPFLDTFMMALPFTYREVNADENTLLKFVLIGKGGGEWFLKRKSNRWELIKQENENVTSETIIDGKIAWKLFTKGMTKEQTKQFVQIKGDKELGEKILEMVSVIA
jgi:hypothetical protein